MHYSHFVPHVQGIEHVSIRCLLDSSHMNQVEKLHSYCTWRLKDHVPILSKIVTLQLRLCKPSQG
jgi:hypothetical protein